MSDDSLQLETIKYKSDDEIADFVDEMARKYSYLFDDFVAILRKGERSLFTLTTDEPNKLMRAIFLALILASIGSNLQNPYQRDFFVQRIRRIAQRFDLEYDDLTGFTLHERSIIPLLSRRVA
jgi:hypothetical protein